MVQRKWKDACDGSNLSLTKQQQFFTFDVMGDLVFGQAFDCLANWGYHPWVEVMFNSIKAGAFLRAASHWPILMALKTYMIPPALRKQRIEQQARTKEKADQRRSIEDGRLDLISGFLLPDSGVKLEEYDATVSTLIIAGSETTATLMSGLTYYILRDSERAAKLQAEIRNAFSTADEIDYSAVNKLPYLLACLDEALRIYPPVPETLPRNTGPSTEVICGKPVPPWVSLIPPRRWSRLTNDSRPQSESNNGRHIIHHNTSDVLTNSYLSAGCKATKNIQTIEKRHYSLSMLVPGTVSAESKSTLPHVTSPFHESMLTMF